jgi:hypothetical protein
MGMKSVPKWEYKRKSDVCTDGFRQKVSSGDVLQRVVDG